MPLRPAEVSDAAELTDVVVAQRRFLDPWEPVRPAEWFTVAGQHRILADGQLAREQDRAHPFVITDAAGVIVGRLTINNVVRGAGQFASLGYWVAREHNGRGVATAAVAEAVAIGFTDLNLHRLEAGTLMHNTGSQKVLERNGFERYGLAPHLVLIAGRWQDHVLYQRLNHDWVAS